MSQKYIIEHVSDFLKVPPDKLETCLSEFVGAVKSVSATVQIMKSIGDKLEIPQPIFLLPRMTWVDDEKRVLDINFSVKDESKATPRAG